MKWTLTEAEAARREGWRINLWGYIRPMNDVRAFYDHDPALFYKVLEAAKAGSELHTKAIAYITFLRLTGSTTKSLNKVDPREIEIMQDIYDTEN